MRQQYEADAEADAAGDSGPRQRRDYSLKEGQTIRIALPDKVGNALSFAQCSLFASHWTTITTHIPGE